MTGIQKKHRRTLSRWVRGPILGARVQRLDGIRVLLVDDDSKNREVLDELLGLYGAQTTACASGAEALDAIHQSRFDLVTCDLSMPEMDGFELIKQIRTLPDPGKRGLPAVAITGHSEPEYRSRACAAGFQWFFVKPVDWKALLDAICALARRPRLSC